MAGGRWLAAFTDLIAPDIGAVDCCCEKPERIAPASDASIQVIRSAACGEVPERSRIALSACGSGDSTQAVLQEDASARTTNLLFGGHPQSQNPATGEDVAGSALRESAQLGRSEVVSARGQLYVLAKSQERQAKETAMRCARGWPSCCASCGPGAGVYPIRIGCCCASRLRRRKRVAPSGSSRFTCWQPESRSRARLLLSTRQNQTLKTPNNAMDITFRAAI